MGKYSIKYFADPSIDMLVGLIPLKIEQHEDEIRMVFFQNRKCRFYHAQDCCEVVYIDDVNGDWEDLIGTPLLVAEERTSTDRMHGDELVDSLTYTFYTFRSIKGSVDVRWRGESNGYYSESVDLEIEIT